MRRVDLKVELTETEIDKLMQRFHFGEDSKVELISMQREILPVIDVAGEYEIRERADGLWAKAFVSLGRAFDEMQELYAYREDLTKEYMQDCLGLELLLKAYDELIHRIQRVTGMWVLKLDFPEEIDMEFMSRVSLAKTAKSVYMEIPLVRNRPENDPCNICSNCGNINCAIRTGGLLG